MNSGMVSFDRVMTIAFEQVANPDGIMSIFAGGVFWESVDQFEQNCDQEPEHALNRLLEVRVYAKDREFHAVRDSIDESREFSWRTIVDDESDVDDDRGDDRLDYADDRGSLSVLAERRQAELVAYREGDEAERHVGDDGNGVHLLHRVEAEPRHSEQAEAVGTDDYPGYEVSGHRREADQLGGTGHHESGQHGDSE